MPQIDISNPEPRWNPPEKIAFRFFFIYFLLQVLPLDWKYFRDVFAYDWSDLNYGIIFNIAHYAPRIVSHEQSFADWAILAGIAIVGTFAWSIADRKRTDYADLYYSLRVILRYRLALAVLAYGFLKFFPIQSPYPSLSNLNTNYGDYSAWKIFSLSLGVVPDYQAFLGFVEILAGLLLLNRKTTAIGAFIILSFTGNVVLSNIAYEGGEYVYSAYLVTIAVFLLAYDIPRLVRLLTLEKPTFPNRYHPVFDPAWKKNGRLVLKGSFIFLFVFFYGFKTYQGSRQGLTKYPSTPGLPDAAGIYAVSVFKINQDTIPASHVHPLRWKDVVFETWNTVSVRTTRPVKIDPTNIEYVAVADADRLYELEGTAGRHYYSYEIDTAQQVLNLRNRNKNHPETLQLKYKRPDSATIILSGVNENKDSIFTVLTKIDKKYLLQEAAKTGRRGGLKL